MIYEGGGHTLTHTDAQSSIRITATNLLAWLGQAAEEGGVAVRLLQQGHHIFGVELPPREQVVGLQLVGVGRRAVTFDLAPLSVVGVMPRLDLAQEVHHLGVVAVPGEIEGVEWTDAPLIPIITQV